MAFKFSQNLRDQLIEYFWKYHNLTISEEQADEYLNSMADLYSAFNKKNAGANFCPFEGQKISPRSYS